VPALLGAHGLVSPPFQLPLSWSVNFEPEFVDTVLQIALSTHVH
jgi:hypothetical protein